jgi:hypothetical protein
VKKTKKKPADALLEKTVALVAAGGALMALRKAGASVHTPEHIAAFTAAIRREQASVLELVKEIHGDTRISGPDLTLRLLTLDWTRAYDRITAGESAPPLVH